MANVGTGSNTGNNNNMGNHKRILVTGHRGYIGSVMAPMLVDAGYDVVGLDIGYFDECTLIPDKTDVPSIHRDLRDLELDDVAGCDAVVHLAALSNDPLGDLGREWTESINYRGSVRLAEMAKAAGVQRFLFSSSCIMYGTAEAAVATEESPVAPKTIYGESKILGERAIAELADDHFSPTFLRNGTVYGLSPRMRFDTVLNNFVGSAVTSGKVIVYSDGEPWRPVVHVTDVARSFIEVLEAPIDLVHNQTFNNGAEHLNYQIRELAEIVVETVPGATLEVRAEPSADQRTYKTGFGKFARTFPDFQFKWDARDGARELYDACSSIKLTAGDFEDKRFTRLEWLKYLLASGRLDHQLRWRGDEREER